MDTPVVPFLIEFPGIGSSEIGYISVYEETHELISFKVKRVFWTYHTPESVLRGRHANKVTEEILIAVAGIILVTIEDTAGKTKIFKLDRPSLGLYMPPHVWHTMQYSHNAVQLVLASTLYSEDDYLRTKEAFYDHWGQQ